LPLGHNSNKHMQPSAMNSYVCKVLHWFYVFWHYYMRWCIFTPNKMHMLSPYCPTQLLVHIYWFPSDSTLDISIIIFITNIPDSLLRYLFHCLSVCLDISIIIIEDIKTVYTNTHKYLCNHLDVARCWWCKSSSSWEPQEEGMMSTAASFSFSKKPRFVSPGKSQTPECDAC
jgi:hypothetical protein